MYFRGKRRARRVLETNSWRRDRQVRDVYCYDEVARLRHLVLSDFAEWLSCCSFYPKVGWKCLITPQLGALYTSQCKAQLEKYIDVVAMNCGM